MYRSFQENPGPFSTSTDAIDPYSIYQSMDMNGEDPMDLNSESHLQQRHVEATSPNYQQFVGGTPFSSMLREERMGDLDLLPTETSSTQSFGNQIDYESLPSPSLAYQDSSDAPWDSMQATTSPNPPQHYESRFTEPSHFTSSLPIPTPRTSRGDWGQASHESPDQRRTFDATPHLYGYEADTVVFSDEWDASPNVFSGHMMIPGSPTASTVPSEYDAFHEDRRKEQRGQATQSLAEVDYAPAGIDLTEMDISQSSSQQSFYRQPENILTASSRHSLHWQDALAGVANQFHSPSNAFSPTPYEHPAQRHQPQYPIPATRNPFSPQNDDPLGLTKVGVVDDGISSNKYEGDIAASFPPTAGHFPPAPGLAQRACKEDSAKAKRRSNLTTSRRASKGRPRVSSMTSNASHISTNLAPVLEGQESASFMNQPVFEVDEVPPSSLSRSTSGKNRARRNGPLEEHTRIQTSERRRLALACIQCRSSKISCDQMSPCDKCQKKRRAKVPCVAAEWSKDVVAACCEGLFHRTVSHIGSDGLSRDLSHIPTGIHVTNLLMFFEHLRHRYSIRVQHMSMHSYEVDLNKCCSLLADLKSQTHEISLRDIFTEEKTTDIANMWMKAVTQYDRDMTDAERLFNWAVMPSRATYTLIPLDGISRQPPINIYNQLPLYAAILNRIVLRAAEILAHASLQSQCNYAVQTGPNVDFARLHRNVCKVGCALRLRYAWCLAHERTSSPAYPHGSDPDILKRVMKSLYFWSFKIRDRSRKEINSDLSLEQNFLVVYGRQVDDPLPRDESEVGFNKWLQHGNHILTQAGLGPEPSPAVMLGHSQPATSAYNQPFTWGQQLSAF